MNWDLAAAELWPHVRAVAVKGKLFSPGDAERLLARPELEAVEEACLAMQRWCWVRGMPPLDRVVAHPRTQGPVRVACDYDVFFEAMAVDVHTERFALAYPWTKVPDPEPQHLAWAHGIVNAHAAVVRAFRFLDLELDLRERDEARGRRRPAPASHPTWSAVQLAHKTALSELAAFGLTESDLRPPGKAPYPPPGPRETSWAH